MQYASAGQAQDLDILPPRLHSNRAVPLFVDTELEVMEVPSSACRYQLPFVVDVNLKLRRDDVVDHVQLQPPIVHALRHRLTPVVVVHQIAVVDVQHQRRGRGARAEHLHHGDSGGAFRDVNFALELPYSREVGTALNLKRKLNKAN